MFDEVGSEESLGGAGEAADGAGGGGVQDPVHSQAPRCAEARATVGAGEGLCDPVGEAVVPQVVRPTELLVTLQAGEGALVCVRSLVDQQVVALGELALTELADVSLLLSLGGRRILSRGHYQPVPEGGQEQVLQLVLAVGEGCREVGQAQGGHGHVCTPR